jgi:hypothetical protein
MHTTQRYCSWCQCAVTAINRRVDGSIRSECATCGRIIFELAIPPDAHCGILLDEEDEHDPDPQ